MNSNTRMGLVICLCSNSNNLISLIPRTASNFRHLLSCGTIELRHTYNLPFGDENVRKMSVQQWKAFVNNVIREEASTRLRIHCANNRKACYLHYESFNTGDYCLTKISIREKRPISRVFSLLIVPSPFFVHCPYKGRINRLKPY